MKILWKQGEQSIVVEHGRTNDVAVVVDLKRVRHVYIYIYIHIQIGKKLYEIWCRLNQETNLRDLFCPTKCKKVEVKDASVSCLRRKGRMGLSVLKSRNISFLTRRYYGWK